MSGDEGCSPPTASSERTVRIRRLSNDEVRKWRDDVSAKMAALERKWEKSGQTDLHALLGALVFCQAQLPPWLFNGLHQMLKARLPQEPDMHWWRWLLVKEGRGKRLSWENAYEYAAEQARGKYAGTARTMKRSYQIAQGELRRKMGQQQQAKLGPGQK